MGFFGRLFDSTSNLNTNANAIGSMLQDGLAAYRGQPGEMRMVRFEKHGAKLFLVQDNTRYIADSKDKDERAAVRESFANAVLWSGEILVSEGARHLIDYLSAQLRRTDVPLPP